MFKGQKGRRGFNDGKRLCRIQADCPVWLFFDAAIRTGGTSYLILFLVEVQSQSVVEKFDGVFKYIMKVSDLIGG